MKMVSRKLNVVMLTIVLITSACGRGNLSSAEPESLSNPLENSDIVDQAVESQQDKSNSPQSEAEDVVVQGDIGIRTFDASMIEITLDENLVTKETIGPEGGSFSVTDTKGTQYTLIIPEGALLYEEEITMTPIANIDGEVISEIFQAGVKLEPEGLHFLELVSVEIISNDIEEGAVGFTTQSGGENFHLIPSISSVGTLTITTTHFTEFGVSQEMIEDVEGLSKLIGEIKLEHELAKGDDNQKLAALDHMIEEMVARGEEGINLNNWESWTTETLSLILRVDEVAVKNKWNANTPGFIELMSELQILVDLWFQESDGVVQEIREKCVQGEVGYGFRGVEIITVGPWLVNKLTLGESKNNQINKWRDTLRTCFDWGVIWQANVVTTGPGFKNDISLGAERNLVDDFFNDSRDKITSITNLEVEYIEGFFENLCVPKDGKIDLKIGFEKNYANLGMTSNLTIEGLQVKVNIIEQVFIDCGQGYSQAEADAQRPFHGEPLDRLNFGRLHDDYWEFVLDYNPGGGVIAQFEEGPLALNWSDGQYDLWQLVTVYQTTPAD